MIRSVQSGWITHGKHLFAKSNQRNCFRKRLAFDDHNPSYGSLGCVIQIVCPISLLFYDKVTKDVFYKTNPCFGNEPMHGGLFR